MYGILYIIYSTLHKYLGLFRGRCMGKYFIIRCRSFFPKVSWYFLLRLAELGEGNSLLGG